MLTTRGTTQILQSPQSAAVLAAVDALHDLPVVSMPANKKAHAPVSRALLYTC
jgi:hypothetical protein